MHTTESTDLNTTIWNDSIFRIDLTNLIVNKNEYSDNSDNSTAMAPRSLPEILLAFLSLQQFIFATACTENAFVIYVFLRFINLKRISNALVFNLAITDFFTGIGSGIQIFYVFYPKLNNMMTTCMMRSQIISAMTLVSQVTVFLLSFDRYLSICHQEVWVRITGSSLTSAITILPWLICISITIPLFVGWNNWNENAIGCSYTRIFPGEYFWITSIVIVILSFLSCLAHFRIFFAIRKFYTRVKPLTELKKEDVQLQKNIKGAKVMLSITIAFTVCWLPYTSFMLAFASGYKESWSLNSVSPWLVFLGIMNSVLNPVIYAWYKGDFRKASRKACSCCYVQFIPSD